MSARQFIRSVLLIAAFIQIASAAILLLQAQTPGKDGAKTVAGTETVNIYTRLTNNVSAGATQLRVTSSTGFAAGDLVMIYQAQGATLNWASNSSSYGAVTAYNSAGRYELRGVLSIQSSTRINIIGTLSNSYSAAGNTQVIRVPQYTTLTIPVGTSITAPAWNGQTGGIVAAEVQGACIVAGGISANGLGFRGGALTTSSTATTDYTTYRTTDVAEGAEKGEGIGGSSATYDSNNGRYGRGAPANGGGGGNSHNAGGGGGANGGDPNAWTGQGIMCTTCPGSAAWAMDPGYITNSTFTTSTGGGRGGYTYSANNVDALTQGPGNTAWGGSNRLERGGLGGRPLIIDPCTNFYFGGGGGAGSQNNASGGAGGNGGGIILINAATISGTGSITANGNAGGNTYNTHNDAPGGGGGGGTILLHANGGISGVTITAHGGAGGNQLITTIEGEGAGGGGGGGFIATTSTSLTATAYGGSNGTTNSLSLTEFTPNGATSGSNGSVSTSASCFTTLPVELVSFTAEKMNGRVLLRWKTATESNNAGFEVERRFSGQTWAALGFVPGAGTSNIPQSYTFEDLVPEDESAPALQYRLRQMDRDGSQHLSPIVDVQSETDMLRTTLGAYPDPFETSTTLHFTLAESGVVTLTVYDALGRGVARLLRAEHTDAGSHMRVFNGTGLPAGLYHAVLETPRGNIAKRVILR